MNRTISEVSSGLSFTSSRAIVVLSIGRSPATLTVENAAVAPGNVTYAAIFETLSPLDGNSAWQ